MQVKIELGNPPILLLFVELLFKVLFSGFKI
jgi:hypothetical protein